ncbi:hypothetical protein HK104_006312 [Borealophlyctis nickersoniae]|nr:hypothetical protein HK104_006312 [Borealophlyctis nickersoniae]
MGPGKDKAEGQKDAEDGPAAEDQVVGDDLRDPTLDKRALPSSPTEGGIVTVVSGSGVTKDEPELEALARIPRFEPLVKSSVAQGFTWGGLFASSGSRAKAENPYVLDPKPIDAMCRRCMLHMKQCAEDVARDQKLLADSMVHMDEYCAKLANTITNRCYEAKTQGDQLNGIITIKKHAEKTNALLRSVMSSIEKLDGLLPATERLSHPDNEKRYPALTKMMAARKEKSKNVML